jgi:hypothetical protein
MTKKTSKRPPPGPRPKVDCVKVKATAQKLIDDHPGNADYAEIARFILRVTGCA